MLFQRVKNIIISVNNTCYWFWLKPTAWNLNVGANKENSFFLRLFNRYKISKYASVLDVGCGYGRILKLLTKHGYHPLGVEVNTEIVNENKNQQLNCIHIDELLPDKTFDVIIMSHVIEHFDPHSLLIFMDKYLQYLNVNGYLFIYCYPLYE